jgi:hypothetical protein
LLSRRWNFHHSYVWVRPLDSLSNAFCNISYVSE